jgi:hypothetical protein
LRRIEPFALTVLLLSVARAPAQAPPPVPMPTPHFNESSPLVLPQAPEVPVSPGTPSGLGSTATVPSIAISSDAVPRHVERKKARGVRHRRHRYSRY